MSAPEQTVHLEPIQFILRAWDDGGEYGEPYQTSASVTIVEPGVAVVRGFTGNVTLAGYKALLREARKFGIREIRFDRMKSDAVIKISRETACA